MKINNRKLFLGIVLLCVGMLSARAQRMSPEDMVAREKQNVYGGIKDLSADQKELLDGIYDEFTQTFKEARDEIMKTRDWGKMRTRMEALRNEKDGLVADVLDDDQFLIYKKMSEGRRGTNEEETLLPERTQWKASGVLADADDGTAVIGATVRMINIRDSLKSKYAITDYEGKFLVQNLENAFYKVIISSMGYQPYTNVVRVGVVDLNLGKVTIRQDSKMLDAVEVKGEVIAIEKKGDTTQFNADAYKVNKDASTKDLVSKMPGIVVDGTGVTANGETIQQVLLDGKRFFGQDPLLSLNTIPAEVVKNIQVFDQKSERSQFTGFDDGNTTKTMNVVTREDKRNGKFGKFYGGYGTNDHYKAGANINSFNNDRRVTLIGMSNNINVQNFSSEDLAGVGGGGGGFRRGNSGGSFLTGTQSGITQTNSVGLNFTDNLSEKATFEGSYFFNQTSNSNDTYTNRQLATDGSDYYTAENKSESDNMNHRLNMRINYNINDKNRLVVRPSISFQDNESQQQAFAETRDSNGDVIKTTTNNYTSLNKSYNFRNDIDFQHKFNKIGRTISVELGNQIRDTDRKNYQRELLTEAGEDSLTNYRYFTTDKSYSYNSEITYTEPVGTNGQLSGSYEINYNDRLSDKEAYTGSDESEEFDFNSELSNDFESGYTTHQGAIAFSNRGFGKFFRARLTYQHAILSSTQRFPEVGNFQRKFNNILPSVMGRVDFKGGGDMFFRYSTDTDEPSVNQLQNVVDRSNTLLWSIGNPNLKQSYSHSLFMRMGKNNVDKNTSISNFIRAEVTNNYVTNATQFARTETTLEDGTVVPAGTQLSIPINLDGYWSVSNNTTHGVLISKIKSNLNTSVGVSYRRLPGMNNNIKNFANTYSGNVKVSLVSNISENVDFNIYYNNRASKVINSSQSASNSNYLTQTLGGNINLTFWKGLVLRSDIYHEKYNGVNDAFNTTYTLWNMSLAKKLLKNDMGEIELSVFDLLKQNRSISQSVTPTYLEETRTQVLQQYFMLTFTYQLRQFKGA